MLLCDNLTPKVAKFIFNVNASKGRNYLLTMLIAWEFTLLDKIFSAKWEMQEFVAYNILFVHYIVILPESNLGMEVFMEITGNN